MCVCFPNGCVCLCSPNVFPHVPHVCVCVYALCVCAHVPHVCVCTHCVCVCTYAPTLPHVCVCVRGVPNGGAIEQTCPGNEESGGSVLELYKHFIDLVFTF